MAGCLKESENPGLGQTLLLGIIQRKNSLAPLFLYQVLSLISGLHLSLLVLESSFIIYP